MASSISLDSIVREAIELTEMSNKEKENDDTKAAEPSDGGSTYSMQEQEIVEKPKRPEPLPEWLGERDENDPLKGIIPGPYATAVEIGFRDSSDLNKAFCTFIRNTIWRGAISLNFKNGAFKNMDKSYTIRGCINWMLIRHGKLLDRHEKKVLKKLGRVYANAMSHYGDSITDRFWPDMCGDVTREWLISHDARPVLEDLVYMFERDAYLRKHGKLGPDHRVPDLNASNQPDLAVIERMFTIKEEELPEEYRYLDEAIAATSLDDKQKENTKDKGQAKAKADDVEDDKFAGSAESTSMYGDALRNINNLPY